MSLLVDGFVEGPVTVRVPATTANLGPGFDSLGLALSLHDVLTATVTDRPDVEVEVEGEGAATVPRDGRHLVVRSLREGLAALGASGAPGSAGPGGLRLQCRNAVPHGRGLGSSSAAIVAALALARALVADGDERLPDPALLALAARIEGHPDNVAPAVLGGLTVAWSPGDGPSRAARLEPDPALRVVAFVPPDPLPTRVARGLLPATVPHADASANAGRAALLVAALAGRLTGQLSGGLEQAVLDGTEDRLHQQYRAPAMPDSAALLSRLRAAGTAAAISGAGPTVVALLPGAAGHDVASLVEVARPPVGWRVLPLEVDPDGVTLLR
ncbi:MAG: Homoserine kinase [uncultured Nocardioidaceae bacterium]|uniref:Homoserine kinase n=1 Tax=uncultured Nocardioidaceae bacterium TaxID=253824 RepID=A0A6J4L6T6_9ACTN|nr:MAG: Homoserine kinase [uncultured Nocardioidaceae bacterium]